MILEGMESIHADSGRNNECSAFSERIEMCTAVFERKKSVLSLLKGKEGEL